MPVVEILLEGETHEYFSTYNAVCDLVTKLPNHHLPVLLQQIKAEMVRRGLRPETTGETP